MKKMIRVLAPVIFIGFGACNDQHRIEPSDLVGKYSYNFSPKSDSIFVNKNLTYEHRYYKDGILLHLTKGSWRYDSTIGYIFFDDYTWLNDEGPYDLRGTWGPEVTISPNGREIRLIYSSENNIFYSKPLD